MSGAPCHLCRSNDLAPHFETSHHRYLHCRRCGLIAREGIESDGAMALYRTDAYQKQQAPCRLHLREAIFRHSLDQLARLRPPGRLPSDPAKPGRLLDVGCGDGLFLKLAADRGWQSHGVELSPMAVEQARRRLGAEHDRIICDELSRAHFSEGYFDVVTLFNVLDQVAAPLELLREAHRVLKAGGLLIVRVPNAAFHAALFRLWPALERQLIFLLYSFSAAPLGALLKQAGYREIRIVNSPLTAGDPYGASPFLGERGMRFIKGVIFGMVQVIALLSGHRLLLGPSLMAYAMKPRSAT